MNQRKPPRKSSSVNSYARYSGIAIQMLAIIGLGSYGGVKLDELYPNKYHVYTLVCSLASIAIAMYLVIKQVNNNSKN
ncbi:MAG: AtpZ/AtpI family protein [Flavobacteriaceae bacterium]